MKTLLIIPPFTQANTVYPSIIQLAGFLKSHSYDALSYDLSLETLLSIFSENGLKKIFLEIKKVSDDESLERMLSLKMQYIKVIENVILFLQGKDDNLANRLLKDGYLPQGNSFTREIDEQKYFGEFNQIAKARYYCSLLLEDLIELIKKTIAPHFGFSRYAEKISISPASFDVFERELKQQLNIVEKTMIENLESKITQFNPEVFIVSVPFPGNLLSALICGKFIKENYPEKKIILGGGFVNTELRWLKDPRIFNYIDFITLDDGELPVLNILQNLANQNRNSWVRTFTRIKNKIEYLDNSNEPHLKHEKLPPPCYNGIKPDNYISLTETLNPMHHLWVAGFWNKLTLARGCYWHKCAFCDTSLDYIKKYSPASAKTIVDWIESSTAQTGKKSFHFTDEAAPPNLLKEVAIEILKRKIDIVWWGNIRFEKNFSKDLCHLLAQSGCIAVSGGLETAGSRLLRLINKGVTLEQTANVCMNFQSSGIMVHAYLMYGFPTQTEQEVVDSLEFVRQLFELELVQSAYWHRFALTCHSPIGQEPKSFGVKITSSFENKFCNNELNYIDDIKVDYQKYSTGLEKATYNWIHKIGIDWQIKEWFDFKIPKPIFRTKFVESILATDKIINENMRIFWFGGTPKIEKDNLQKTKLIVHTNNFIGDWDCDSKTAVWLKKMIEQLIETQFEKGFTLKDLKNSFPKGENDFENFITSQIIMEMRESKLFLFV